MSLPRIHRFAHAVLAAGLLAIGLVGTTVPVAARAWCPGFGYGQLAPGASATINVTVQLPASGGNSTMTATIDPYNSVSESNESNNQRALALNMF
jgi:hypothetical protein